MNDSFFHVYASSHKNLGKGMHVLGQFALACRLWIHWLWEEVSPHCMYWEGFWSEYKLCMVGKGNVHMDNFIYREVTILVISGFTQYCTMLFAATTIDQEGFAFRSKSFFIIMHISYGKRGITWVAWNHLASNHWAHGRSCTIGYFFILKGMCFCAHNHGYLITKC